MQISGLKFSKKEELEKKIKKEGYLVYDEKNIAEELKIPYNRGFCRRFHGCSKTRGTTLS